MAHFHQSFGWFVSDKNWPENFTRFQFTRHLTENRMKEECHLIYRWKLPEVRSILYRDVCLKTIVGNRGSEFEFDRKTTELEDLCTLNRILNSWVFSLRAGLTTIWLSIPPKNLCRHIIYHHTAHTVSWEHVPEGWRRPGNISQVLGRGLGPSQAVAWAYQGSWLGLQLLEAWALKSQA